jgi:hypothetical protein
MEYFLFALIVVVLAAVIFLISKMDVRTKNKHKNDAYRLLETHDPHPKEIKDTLRGLRLYAGRWKKDKECIQLAKLLNEKHGHLLT